MAPDMKAEMTKAWRLATAPLRAMPGFVIAGAPKCGTSSLYDCITLHPDVRRGFRKEPTNFIHYPGSRWRAAMNYPMRTPGAAFVVGDGSVEYFTHPHGPANVQAVIPEARLIFLLRDPVARAWSDHQMYRKHGMDTADFTETVIRAMKWLEDPDLEPLIDAAAKQAIHPARYVLCGMYARALGRWFREFPRLQCLVLFSEDFDRDPEGTMREVFAHLNLRIVPVEPPPRARLGEYEREMPISTQQKMREFFAPHDARLAEMLGRDLPWR